MALIFVEIIQLNFCGLSIMTKKSIEKRANSDSIFNIENDKYDNINDLNKKDTDSNIDKITCSEYSYELKNINNEQSFLQINSDT